MADGSYKNVEDIEIGEEVKTHNGTNVVRDLERTVVGDRKLYDINNTGNYFVTEDHMFMTSDGWKSINPEMTRERYPHYSNLITGKLEIGSTIVTEDGLVEIRNLDTSLVCSSYSRKLYDLTVTDDESLFANGFLAHNCSPPPPPGVPTVIFPMPPPPKHPDPKNPAGATPGPVPSTGVNTPSPPSTGVGTPSPQPTNVSIKPVISNKAANNMNLSSLLRQSNARPGTGVYRSDWTRL
jgi:hypothetical protein